VVKLVGQGRKDDHVRLRVENSGEWYGGAYIHHEEGEEYLEGK